MQNQSLRQITERIFTRYQEALVIKGINAQIIASDDYVINCDVKLIEQAISNFLSNAVWHTPVDGEIKISITKNDGHVLFSIENSGQHIPPDKIKHIWDAYYKTDTARSNPKGTGLGLSIVKNILDAHGFKYGAENTESGVKIWFSC
jgi:signal transduction histidine kinase